MAGHVGGWTATVVARGAGGNHRGAGRCWCAGKQWHALTASHPPTNRAWSGTVVLDGNGLEGPYCAVLTPTHIPTHPHTHPTRTEHGGCPQVLHSHGLGGPAVAGPGAGQQLRGHGAARGGGVCFGGGERGRG